MLETNIFSFFPQCFRPYQRKSHNTSHVEIVVYHQLDETTAASISWSLKVALQVLGQKFYKNTKKSSLYSQSLLIFIYRTLLVERHPITREIKRFSMAQADTNGKHGLFLHEQLIHLHTKNTQTKFQTRRSMKILWKIITCLLCYGI